MKARDFFDAFEFNNNQLVYHQIDSVSKLKRDFIVNKGKAQLSLDLESSFLEFIGQTCLICAFQKTWAEHRMDLHRSFNNPMAHLIGAHGFGSRCLWHWFSPYLNFGNISNQTAPNTNT